EDVIAAGGAGIADEEPRPAESGLGDRAAGRAELGLGRALSSLGRALGLDRLQQLGQRLIERAMERVPRLTEEILGKREAALRDLLRRFQSGDVEEALRKALPFAEEERPPKVTGPPGAKLWTHDLRYSLDNIRPYVWGDP